VAGDEVGDHGYRAALRVPIVRRLVGATTASVIGDYIGVGALLVMAVDRTGGSAVGAAGVFAAAVPVTVVVGTLGGPLLDRVRRVPALVSLELLGALLICLPLLVEGVPVVYLTAALLAGQRTATGAIRQGVIAQGVATAQRPALLALGNTIDQGAQVLGYLTGAALYLAVSVEAALLLDAASFVVAALLIVGVRLGAHAAPPGDDAEAPSFSTGLRIIVQQPALRLFGLLTILTATAGALPETLAPTVVPGDDRVTPLLLAAAPLGQAVTIVVLGRTRLVARPWFQLGHLALLAVALLLAAAAPNPGSLVVANLLVGAGVAWILGPQLTFLRLTPPARMAQVAALMWAAIAVAEGGGSLLYGGLADRFGLATAYAVAGALLAVTAAAGVVAARRSVAVADLDRQVLAEVGAVAR
jgi:predicted MFS family arabinose efflux permease